MEPPIRIRRTWQRCIYPNATGIAPVTGFPVCQNGLPPTQSSSTTKTWYTASNQITSNASPVCGSASSYYDCAGNLTQIPLVSGATQTYDAENRIASVTGSGSTTYIYDGDGRRVEKWIAGTIVTYVYDASGALAAEYSGVWSPSPCSTCYLTKDHVGSTRLVSSQSGSVVGRHDFLPFGEEIPSGTNGRSTLWGAADSVNQKFTGQVRDVESTFDYFGARYYGSSLGRFTSPDPSRLSAFIESPQSWNMYAYSYNNPLSFVDKNGKWPTNIHNQIIDNAFPNLTAHQRQILKDVSKNQDGLLNGGQSGALSFQHEMRASGQSIDDAKAEYDAFVSINEDTAFQTQMNFWAAGNPGLSDDALAEFAAALHAIEDSTSPAHAGFQVWEWWNPKLVLNHIRTESSISPQQMANSVTAARNAFNVTFNPPLISEFDLLQLSMQPVQKKEKVTSKIRYNTDEDQ